MSADDLTREELADRLEHAEQALTGSNEGCRLWFLDCAELTAKHRTRAEDAAARWQALRDWLSAQMDADLKAADGSIAWIALASSRRATLARMRELEAGK